MKNKPKGKNHSLNQKDVNRVVPTCRVGFGGIFMMGTVGQGEIH